MAGEWVCLIVHSSYRKRGRAALKADLKAVFGGDLLDVQAVLEDDGEELYVFVLCRTYFPHIQRLRSCYGVKGVLSSFENPTFLSQHEVSEFIGSFYEEESGEVFNVGDVVQVKNGYLSGLKGLVESRLSEMRCRVTFSFYTRNFSEELDGKEMERIDNVFDHIKNPVRDLEADGIQWVGTTGIQFYGGGIVRVN